MPKFYPKTEQVAKWCLEVKGLAAIPKVKTKSVGATVVGLFISLIGFWLIAYVYYAVADAIAGVSLHGSPLRLLIYNATQATGFLLLLVVLRREGNSFNTVLYGGRGLRELGWALAYLVIAWVAWGLMTWLCLYIIAATTGTATNPLEWRERLGVVHHTPLDTLAITVFCTCAAFFEEVFYRGYAFTRIYSLTGSLKLAAIANIGFFTLIHLVFGPLVMACIAVWATIQLLLLLHRGSTWATLYYHLVNNILAYVVLPLSTGG